MTKVSEHLCGHCGSKNVHPSDEKCSDCSTRLDEDKICQVCTGRAVWYNPRSDPRDVVVGDAAVKMQRGFNPQIPNVTHPQNEADVVWCGKCQKVF